MSTHMGVTSVEKTVRFFGPRVYRVVYQVLSDYGIWMFNYALCLHQQVVEMWLVIPPIC